MAAEATAAAAMAAEIVSFKVLWTAESSRWISTDFVFISAAVAEFAPALLSEGVTRGFHSSALTPIRVKAIEGRCELLM